MHSVHTPKSHNATIGANPGQSNAYVLRRQNVLQRATLGQVTLFQFSKCCPSVIFHFDSRLASLVDSASVFSL